MKFNNIFRVGFLFICSSTTFLNSSHIKTIKDDHSSSCIVHLEDLHNQPFEIQRQFELGRNRLDFLEQITNSCSSQSSEDRSLNKYVSSNERCNDCCICCKRTCGIILLFCVLHKKQDIHENISQVVQAQLMKRE